MSDHNLNHILNPLEETPKPKKYPKPCFNFVWSAEALTGNNAIHMLYSPRTRWALQQDMHPQQAINPQDTCFVEQSIHILYIARKCKPP